MEFAKTCYRPSSEPVFNAVHSSGMNEPKHVVLDSPAGQGYALWSQCGLKTDSKSVAITTD